MPRLRLLLALPLLLAASAGRADTLLTVRSSIEGLKMDLPQVPDIKIWIAGEKLRRDEGDASYILRLDRNRLYVVNHGERTYSELPLPIDLSKIAAPAAAQMKVQVTTTSETKRIGDWTARKYKVDISNPAGLRLDTTIWASKDIAAYQAYSRMAASLAALQPGSAEWARKLEQIEGFPVVQEVDVTMGTSRFRTREELVAVETRDAPAGAYEVPAGYTAQPFAAGPR
ncbi:MAG TPA: DUF4412 domain-containing protein [Thermoanaerobaculia bacterium]|jgi:hypothetical protein